VLALLFTFGTEAWLPLDTLQVEKGEEKLSVGKRTALENGECIRNGSCHALVEECTQEGKDKYDERNNIGKTHVIHHIRLGTQYGSIKQRDSVDSYPNYRMMPWDGPYTFQSVRSPVTYQIAKRCGRSIIVHHDRLKPCYSRPQVVPVHNDMVVEEDEESHQNVQQQRTDRTVRTLTDNGGVEITDLESDSESTQVEPSAMPRRSGRHKTAPTRLLPGPEGQLQDYNLPSKTNGLPRTRWGGV